MAKSPNARSGNQIFQAHSAADEDSKTMAYEFVEYPKWVTPEGGVAVLVQDEAEEATARAGDKVVREDEERARLLKVAEVKGVTVDKRWGLPKIEKAITDAGFDASLNPFV